MCINPSFFKWRVFVILTPLYCLFIFETNLYYIYKYRIKTSTYKYNNNMRFTAVRGKNHKNFIAVTEATKDELWIYEEVEKIVSRVESKFNFQTREVNKLVGSYWYNNQFFPEGLLGDVKRGLAPLLEYHKLPEIEIENEELFFEDVTREDFNDFIKSLVLPEKYDLFDEKYLYQSEAAFLAILNKIARIEVGTGGGKTMITYLYCKFLKDKIIPKLNYEHKKILIVVPTVDLAKQLKRNFTEYQSLMSEEFKLKIETIYSGSKRFAEADIVCGTWQSLCEFDEDYFDEFCCMICDEAHTSKNFQIRNGIYAKMKHADFMFGMSGTFPKYNTLDYLHISAMFGSPVLVRKTKQLIKDGVVVPVKIHNIKIKYEGSIAGYSAYLKNNSVIGTEKYRLEKTFFETLYERNSLIGGLINGIPGNNLLLVETVDYCDVLKDFLSEVCPNKYIQIIHGTIKSAEREEIKLNMEDRDDVVLIATYGTMSTGVSINNIMNVYFPDGGKSEIRIKQSIGRGLRLHPSKEWLNVFDIQDYMSGSSFWNHALTRNKIYSEEGFPFKTREIKLYKDIPLDSELMY